MHRRCRISPTDSNSMWTITSCGRSRHRAGDQPSGVPWNRNADSSRCVFNGKAIVRQGADGTDAEQANHNLLLSERAEIDTKPELEIYADDVKCSHGATVGELDRRALYYLRTRGLSLEQAARMLTRAFVGQILAGVPIEAVRNYVEGRVDRRLDTLIGGNDS